jgi:hypothetical protein
MHIFSISRRCDALIVDVLFDGGDRCDDEGLI